MKAAINVVVSQEHDKVRDTESHKSNEKRTQNVAVSSPNSKFSLNSEGSSEKNSTNFESIDQKESKQETLVLKEVHYIQESQVQKTHFSLLREKNNMSNTLQVYTKKTLQQTSADNQDRVIFGTESESKIAESFINEITQLVVTPKERDCINEKCKKLVELGVNLWKKGDNLKAVEHLEEVLRQSQDSYPEDENEKALLYSVLGNSYLRMSVYDKGAYFYHKALTTLAKNPEEHSSKCADIHLSLGIIYEKTNNYNEAIDHVQHSFKLKRTWLSQNSSELLSILTNLAFLQTKRGYYTKASKRFGQALKINLSLYGAYHYEVANSYYLWSQSLFMTGEYEAWLDQHYRSIKIMQHLHLESSPECQYWLKMFKARFHELVERGTYTQTVIQKSVHIATLILNKDQQIVFLSKIKANLEGTTSQQRQ